jgi:hypothetical protein
MLTPDQSTRIARKCASALGRSIDALPQLLADSEPEKAAAIVADLVKTLITSPVPEPDPAAALNEVIRIASLQIDREDVLHPADPPFPTF